MQNSGPGFFVIPASEPESSLEKYRRFWIPGQARNDKPLSLISIFLSIYIKEGWDWE